MSRGRLRAVLVAAVVATAPLAAAPAAPAALFPGETIDGPSPDILSASDVDVARDGGGVVTYLKRTGGVAHVWVSRMVDGAWSAPEQIDIGQPGASSDPHVAVSDGGRAVVTWINAGRLFASLRESVATGWGEAVQVDAGPVQHQSLDMSLHGKAYSAYTIGSSSHDVRSAKLEGTTWTTFPTALDADPPRDAGGGNGPVVAAAADGTGIAAWEEVGADGRWRVFSRRVLRDGPSTFVREASIPALDGHTGGDARNPDIGMDDDSSYGWVAVEQDFDDGGVQRPRVFGRPVLGVDLEEPVVLDGQAFGSGVGASNPDIDVTGRVRALEVSESAPGAATLAAVLQIDAYGFIGAIDSQPNASAANPVASESPNGEGVFAWFEDPSGPATAGVMGRFWNRDDVLEGEVALANPDFGPAVASLGMDAASDRVNDTAIAFVQGPPLERRLVVAHQDRPLSATQGSTKTQAWQSNHRPHLTWGRRVELWGPAQYRVELFGQAFTTASSAFDVPFDLPDGSHSWHVVAIDRRGQQTVGADRKLNIDTTPPIALLATTGILRTGQSIRFVTRDDPPPPDPAAPPPAPVRTSGVASVAIRFGDGGRATGTREVRHVYRRKGSYRVRAVVTDKAGNSQIVKLKIKVVKPKSKKKAAKP